MGNLYIRNTPDITERLANYVNLSFMDLVDDLEIADECPEGYRQVMLHILPLQKIDGGVFFTLFQCADAPRVYASRPLTVNDFLCKPGEEFLNLGVSLLGMMTHITRELDMKTFPIRFPDVIDGEFVWSFMVDGSDNQVTDEFIKSLAPVMGNVPFKELLADDTLISGLSKRLVELTAKELSEPKADDMGEGE